MQSEIRAMSIECDKVGGINLSQGVCDTPVPEIVKRAAQKAIDAGENSYTRYDGTERLRRALARKVKRHFGVLADPNGEIIVSAGATGAFYCACLALLNPGDEVVLFEPYYGYHLQTLLAVDMKPVYVPLRSPTWALDEDLLEQAITKRTRGIMINTPTNPTGKVFSLDELRVIARLAKKHDLVVFTDEIYEHFVYDGHQHVSPVTIAGLRERCVAISGLSKTFSVTGWRVGYAIANPTWARAIGYFNDLVYVCAPAPLQAGVAAGLEALDDTFYARIRVEHQNKRELICGALRAAGLTPHVPDGAYYVMADLSSIPGKSSKQRAMRLLKETGVACVPGQAFVHDGGAEHLGRFCYAKTDKDLGEACRRLRKWR